MHFQCTVAVLRLAILTAPHLFCANGGRGSGRGHAPYVHQDHRFQPTELKAPANTPITLIRNLDPTPEECACRNTRSFGMNSPTMNGPRLGRCCRQAA
jgi:hypothetical protein